MAGIKGMVAFVTGAASGLGKATVKHLLSREVGGIVALDIQKFQYELPSNVVTVQGSIASEKDVENAVNVCREQFGKLDTVVNCAGIGVAFKTYNFNKKQPHRLEDFRVVLETNVVGTFNVVRLAVGLIGQNQMVNGLKGCIVNTSGASAFEGMTGQAAISAAYGAINSMTLTLARDLAAEGIRCVTIAPGTFMTPLVEKVPDVALKYLGELVLSPNRLGEPEEFASMVEAVIVNKYLNGEVIRLDGGLRFPG